MGYLRGCKVYLGGPIEHAEDKEDWRPPVRDVLRKEFQIELFDPTEDVKQEWLPNLLDAREACDFDTMSKIAKRFVHKDLSVVDECRFIISNVPRGVPTTGTTHEIINSWDLKKPTLLVCPEGKQYVPAWYYGFIPHSPWMHGSWDSLYDYLREVDAGKHKEETRWCRLYGLV